jgi:hypothetical protein
VKGLSNDRDVPVVRIAIPASAYRSSFTGGHDDGAFLRDRGGNKIEAVTHSALQEETS